VLKWQNEEEKLRKEAVEKEKLLKKAVEKEEEKLRKRELEQSENVEENNLVLGVLATPLFFQKNQI